MDGTSYGKYQIEILSGETEFNRSLGAKSCQWEKAAEEVLPKETYGYLAGGAGEGATMDSNRDAFRRWQIVPRMLRHNRHQDLSIEILGKNHQLLWHLWRQISSGGECAVAAECAKQGVPYIYSTAASTSLEEVALANGAGERWFQLYWPQSKDNDITFSMLSRAEKSGYSVLVITVDLWTLSWRPSMLDDPQQLEPGINTATGFSDPTFRAKYERETGKSVQDDLAAAARAWRRIVFPGEARTWDEVKFIRDQWRGKLVLKGIQTVEDAKLAVQAGVDGIVVSNHGGRQYDGAVASLNVLPEIANAVGDKITILFDSGVRTGADIIKAIALGAKAVLVGRPIIFGLAVGGQEGVSHVLRCLLAELDVSIGQIGISSPKELSTKMFRRDHMFIPLWDGSV